VRVGGKLKAPKRIRHVEPVYPEAARSARVQGVVILEIEIDVTGKVKSARVLRSNPLLDAAAIEAVRQWTYTPTVLNGKLVPVLMTVTVNFRLPEPSQEDKQSSTPPSTDPARAFLEERAETEGLSFQQGSGYWANTYVPGDPALRLLHSRLRDWDRSPLQARVGFPLGLHDVAAQPVQPFDAPSKAGLALYLSADRRGLDKPSRMLLQVGLKGSPRLGGQRPPMSVGVVLDLRGDVPTEAAADMRALALAFAETRQVGDRFSLIVAGRPGGVVVEPEKFKHGPLAVAIDKLMTSNKPETGPALDLPDAVAAAFLEAARCGDPDAALGSSVVVLVTGQPLGGDADILNDLAHQGAVAGMRLSVVGIGPRAPSADLERLALAGQGSRRLLETRSDAPRLVEAELTAASDIVARAIRLRIRLAPGVRLLEIVGSRRLDEAQAQRVREAERSIDLRLSRLLGIDSDRGEDEDGIQIVIPSFHASDAHVILLDVVAPGSGAVADVSVRYKDVVFLRNGVARASLSLPAGEQAMGPLERNVLKNLLALRLADSLAAAGSALDEGDPVRAAAFVERARSTRAGLLASLPGLAGDPELSRDVAMLREYAQLFTSGAATGPQLAYIADSLRYAGRLKLLPRPAPSGVGAL
jgi:Ca-activated chloride channel family protein